MTFREQLTVIQNMIDGALVNDDVDRALDNQEVRRNLCEMLHMEVLDLSGLAEAGDGADE